MKSFLVLFLILSISKTIDSENFTINETDTSTSPPPGQGGKTFFLFGGFFRKIRQRWSGQPDPVPLYAGPAFPVAGYYNCPIYGCNPALTYRPAPYEPINYYHRQPVNPYDSLPPPYGIPIPPAQRQQQQQHTQQSNVVIYQNGQQGYYNPSQSGGPTYYQSVPPLPPPPVNYPPMGSGQNYPSGNGGSLIYQQSSPPYPVNNYGHYGPPVAVPLPPPTTQNFDPIYNQQPTGIVGGPLPMHSPPIGPSPCSPNFLPCHSGG